MLFVPNSYETELLANIIACHNEDFALIRLTDTMLDKSTIDAGAQIRTILSDNSILDYSNLTPGIDKVILDGLLLTNKVTPIKISCYRPQTKKGDPRLWIYGLRKLLRSGEMIYLTVYRNQVCVIPLVNNFFTKKTIVEFFKSDTSTIAVECINLIKRFARKDILSVSPTKSSPKDIGDTLERELNISPNSSKLADYKNAVELKAKRKNAKTLDTLFSMVPNWNKSAVQSSTDMILAYGYPSRKYQDFIDLYVTVSNEPNAQGLYLEVDNENQCLIQNHKDTNGIITPTCIWTFDELKARLYSKHHETLWVIGDEFIKNGEIHFNFESIEHTGSPNFSSFLLLISQGYLTYDWRGRVKSDRTNYKDKGHCFRLKPKYRNILFGNTEILNL